MSTEAMWGADAGALEELGTSMINAGQTLRAIQESLRVRLAEAPWVGDGADRFRSEWDSTYSKAILGAATLADESGRTLGGHAGEQGESSAGAGGQLAALSPIRGPGDDEPTGVDGAKEELSWWGRILLAGKIAVKGVTKGLQAWNLGKYAWSLGKSAEAADLALAKLTGTAPLAGFKLTLAKGLRWVSKVGTLGRYAPSLEALETGSKFLGKWVGPAGAVLFGGIDLVTGGEDHGGHAALTRVAGAAGVVGGGLLLANVGALSAFGVAAGFLGPVGLGIAAGLVIGYGVYSLGNLMYNNREAIGHGISTAYNWAGDRVDDAVNYGKEVVQDFKDSVRRAVTHPLGLLPKLSVF